MMKIATFNANSIRSRIDVINAWLKQNQPHILCIQETKVQNHEFPLDAFANSGYHIAYHGQKKYNGVAIFSDKTINNTITALPGDDDDEARFLEITYNKTKIVNTYIPQGQSKTSENFQYKLNWFSKLLNYFDKTCHPSEPIIWVGDLNIALEDRDVYDPVGLAGDVCFCREVQDALQSLLKWGFVDVFRKFHPEPGHYTFWDYRAPNGFKRNLGWRLDYILATPPLAEKCIDCRIDKQPRQMEKPSDHTFVMAEFNEP